MAGGGLIIVGGANDRRETQGAFVTDHALHVRVVSGAVTIPEPLEVDTSQLENTVVPAGYAVFPTGAERDDILTVLGVADGDWTSLRVDNRGALWIREAITKHVLSGSTSGQPINVPTGPAATLHTVPANVLDCITLYASNPNNLDDTITVTWGTGALALDFFCPCLETVPLTVNIPLEAGEVATAVVATNNVHVVGFVERTAL